MIPEKPTRRTFLGGAATLCGTLATPRSAQASSKETRASSYFDILRSPDSVTAFSGLESSMPMNAQAGTWEYKDIQITTAVTKTAAETELPLRLTSPKSLLTHLHLRWNFRIPSGLRCLGDQWERSYGDLEWRGMVPERVMPWYFLTFDGRSLNGYGVKTQPSAFCFWQLDPEGISLWADVRNGGNPVELGQRELHVATIVTCQGKPGEPPIAVTRQFCKQMCPTPRLPAGPLFGSNDWNYAYGRNSADGILRDADLIASVAPQSEHRPFVVIDDGWQDQTRFPDMSALATKIRSRKLHPGIWIRPLRAAKDVHTSLLLPAARFGESHVSPAYDPTIPEALETILDTIKAPVRWGYEFIKHDFSTYEMLGRWGSSMGAEPTAPGWNFTDRTLTSAEIILHFYRSLRDAAGEKTNILGCNTLGHLAAGIFESQRIGDDTSGTKWERTRRMGVNTLAFRMPQHQTFSYIDPDCVAFTRDIDWFYTRQWLDVVARSGTSLFVSPQREATGAEQVAALKDAFALAVSSRGFAEDWLDNTAPQQWQFQAKEIDNRSYDWSGNKGAFPFQI
jgi:alpha-galactosidase